MVLRFEAAQHVVMVSRALGNSGRQLWAASFSLLRDWPHPLYPYIAMEVQYLPALIIAEQFKPSSSIGPFCIYMHCIHKFYGFFFFLSKNSEHHHNVHLLTYFFVFWGLYPAMFRGFTWICAQKLTPGGSQRSLRDAGDQTWVSYMREGYLSLAPK